MSFYPGFAGRFHKYWEEAYWPCKEACVADRTGCGRSYYEKEQWETCKPRALANHDQSVALPATVSSPALNATPPLIMKAFFGSAVKLIVLLRDPVDRLRHAFYGHPHYGKRYGKSAEGLAKYSIEQEGGWRACERRYGAERCAVHFEQLSREEAAVFFHCDQLIRGMYSTFMHHWLEHFPGQLLAARAEDFFNGARRGPLIAKAWAHLGLATSVPPPATSLPSYTEWAAKHGGPVLAETTSLLERLYKPFNAALRDMLAADGTSCSGAECDAFLWDKRPA
jgi:N-acetylgalactosamine 4-sulfate 6-O-sulfotransferase